MRDLRSAPGEIRAICELNDNRLLPVHIQPRVGSLVIARERFQSQISHTLDRLSRFVATEILHSSSDFSETHALSATCINDWPRVIYIQEGKSFQDHGMDEDSFIRCLR